MLRHERVEEAIKREVSLIIHDEIKDPRIGFVTITRVELSKDLRNAKIFYSVLGKEDDYEKTRLALDSALGLSAAWSPRGSTCVLPRSSSSGKTILPNTA